MTYVRKRFSFKEDTEGWTAHGRVRWDDYYDGFVEEEPLADMSWRKLNGPRDENPAWVAPWLERGGCLRATHYVPDWVEGSWCWNGTWADLGVPAGRRVTAVQVQYLYRWEVHYNFKFGEGDGVLFNTGQVYSGPLTIAPGSSLEVAGVEVVPAVYAPERTIDDPWLAWPAGLPLIPGETWVQTDPPQGWGVAQGALTLLEDVPAAEDVLELRLDHRFVGVQTLEDGKTGRIRLKQDEVVLLIYLDYVGLRALSLAARSSALTMQERDTGLSLASRSSSLTLKTRRGEA